MSQAKAEAVFCVVPFVRCRACFGRRLMSAGGAMGRLWQMALGGP